MAIKKHWSIPDGDSIIAVYGITIIMLILWCITLGGFEIQYKLVGDSKTYKMGGWLERRLKRK